MLVGTPAPGQLAWQDIATGRQCGCRYALLPEQIAAAEQQLEEVAALLQRNRQSSAQAPAALPDGLMGARLLAPAKPS